MDALPQNPRRVNSPRCRRTGVRRRHERRHQAGQAVSLHYMDGADALATRRGCAHLSNDYHAYWTDTCPRQAFRRLPTGTRSGATTRAKTFSVSWWHTSTHLPERPRAAATKVLLRFRFSGAPLFPAPPSGLHDILDATSLTTLRARRLPCRPHALRACTGGRHHCAASFLHGVAWLGGATGKSVHYQT